MGRARALVIIHQTPDGNTSAYSWHLPTGQDGTDRPETESEIRSDGEGFALGLVIRRLISRGYSTIDFRVETTDKAIVGGVLRVD